jgi:hypothetical protein
MTATTGATDIKTITRRLPARKKAPPASLAIRSVGTEVTLRTHLDPRASAIDAGIYARFFAATAALKDSLTAVNRLLTGLPSHSNSVDS